MSDPEAALRARLTALHDQLGRPTPKPLDGQQTIDLAPRYEQPTLDEDTPQ